MKVGKPKSKRVPVRLRHKIEKASASKQRKQRKEAKKNPQWRSRSKKDPGIPNLFPYKAKVLAEIEEGKRRKEEEALKRREVAKAQRQGKAVEDKQTTAAAEEAEEDDDEELGDQEDDIEEDDEMEEDSGNPMAALLASAQARAEAFAPEEGMGEEDEDDDGDDTVEEPESATAPAPSARKFLPKQALADPVKAVSALLDRMRKTTDGIQRLIDHYQMPPLMTAGTDLTSSFLVEVARKRGRLGRGGVPNLHSAALTVLTDLNEERLVLPALDSVAETRAVASKDKGKVQVVSQISEPFRIEGLWEAHPSGNGMMVEEKMVVES